MKQEELKLMREQITSIAEHNTYRGYTEVLLGEKKSENDTSTDSKFKRVRVAMYDLLAKNMERIVDIGNPREELNVHGFNVKEHIDSMERKLGNQYYQKLCQILQEERTRKQKESFKTTDTAK